MECCTRTTYRRGIDKAGRLSTIGSRWLYNHPSFIDRPRPELQEVWGSDNICLYAMPSGTGAGPAVWCHGLIPDYHAFRGRGGYAFALHDGRPTVDATNISNELLSSLTIAYGEQVESVDVFDVFSAYFRRRLPVLFAEDLEDVFPHVPFPAQHNAFLDAVRLGREIRAVETFGRQPAGEYRRSGFVRLETQPGETLGAVEFVDGTTTLCADGSGREFSGSPESVWNFSVSGYRVLPRWLDGRAGLPIDINFINELRDICGRIAELIDLFAQADTVLGKRLCVRR